MNAQGRFARQLLQQADALVRQDPKRPSQASLRRAVSAAYYALFHLLVGESSTRVIGSAAENSALRHTLSRAYNHGDMVKVAKWMQSNSLPDYLRALPNATRPPPDLLMVAGTFVQLQEQRHLADYSLGQPFLKADATLLVQQAEDAFVRWAAIREDKAAGLFLLLLLVGDRMKPR
jgi:hypothetical protein